MCYTTIMKSHMQQDQRFFPFLIFEAQCAYVPRRKIAGNILLAYETIRNFNKKGVKKFCIKVDLQKAYDRINHMLHKMCFAHQLIRLIHRCINSPTFLVLVNGIPQGHISSTKGIKQGSPLSPYLFLIGMEYLSLKF